jgi:hypothetical protein
LGNNKLVTKLLFRGSDNGFYSNNLKDRIKRKGPTIFLFKVLNGDCIGAYTTGSWLSSNDNLNKEDKPGTNYAQDYPSDYFSMLFNLSLTRMFPS